MSYLKNKHFENILDNQNFEIWRLSSKAVQFKNHDWSISGVIYINTVVIEVNRKTREIELNSDGWETITTKKWMNHVLSSFWFRIFQKDYTRYIEDQNKPEVITYKDNMKLKI
jgi:hypothetical protein